MKRTLALLLVIVSISCAAAAETLNGDRLSMAFGLFSVLTDSANTDIPNTGNALGDYRYELDAFPYLIYANYAPLESYEQTAQRNLNSYVSYMYAVLVYSPNSYTETDITEETLPNGIRLRWQLMRGDLRHALWFEAFSENMGYNACLYGDPTDEQDAKMLALMRSFEVNADMERDLLDIRQTINGDGSFISVDHGLRIQLDKTWKPVEYDSMLLDNTAFVLEKEEGRCMIQLLHFEPYDNTDASLLLKWYMTQYGRDFDEEKIYTVEIEGLGVTAYAVDTEDNIYMKNLAFVYQNRCYFGSFMWIKPYDKEMRPFMDEALRGLTPGF